MRYKIVVFLVFTVIVPVFVLAQLNHFIYLQTEGKQPFYAKINKKVLSSSASGYLIIPKLKDGTYDITIGFPKEESDEHTYTCNISNDVGYLVKNFGSKGWGLFNLQNLSILMANTSQTEVAPKDTTKTDEFSSMLSEVVNDPSIKQPEKPVTPIQKTTVPQKKEEKPTSKISGRSVIVKSKTTTTGAAIEAMYFDITGDKQDTIVIIIPVDQDNHSQEKVSSDTSKADEKKGENLQSTGKERKISQVEKNNEAQEIKDNPNVTSEVKSDKAQKEKKFLPIEITTKETDSARQVASAAPMINSDCKAYATEDDFLKLRKKMASEETDEEMISVAQKSFKTKCFTTDQVKNLSVLFLKDAGKYKFFDVAYAFVADSHNFYSLESQLTDSYYISRFKAMVRN